MKRDLTLVPYDPAWPHRFVAESARMQDSIGAHVLAIEHIGSTSVPGMLAKPIIDIAIAVRDDASADACIAPLVSLGYIYRGPYGDDPLRRYYVRDNEQGRRAVHVHLYVVPAASYDEKLALRDALRTDAGLAAAYVAEKRRVAEEVQWNKAAYSEAKGPFIVRTLAALRSRVLP